MPVKHGFHPGSLLLLLLTYGATLLHMVTALPMVSQVTEAESPHFVLVEAGARGGLKLRQWLATLSASTINDFERISEDKGEWLKFEDIYDHGWTGTKESSPTEPRSFHDTRLPTFLEGAVTALTSGRLGRWQFIEHEIKDKPDLNGKGKYDTVYSTQYGIIISTLKQDPMARGAQGVPQRVDDWYDITYLTWAALSPHQSSQSDKPPEIRQMLMVLPKRGPTIGLLNSIDVMTNLRRVSTFENAISYTPTHNTNGFDTLLGSEEGIAIATMLLRRREELGHHEVSEIRFWVPQGGPPCLLFSTTGKVAGDVPAGGTQPKSAAKDSNSDAASANIATTGVQVSGDSRAVKHSGVQDQTA